jgi:predicted small secreted protein
MASEIIRKKVINYINNAEDNVLEVVYKMLQMYEVVDGNGLLTKSQKKEIEKRATLLRQGKLKTSSWDEVKKSADVN